MPRPVAKPHTDEWYAARKSGIGASEMAIAAGLSPYSTPLKLYYQKRGELPLEEDSDAMRLGRLLEPVVKSEFSSRTGIQLADPEPLMYRHDDHEMVLATPDGIVDSTTLFEAKTASWRMKHLWGDQDTDFVPDSYLVQCQSQLAVMGADLCHLAVLFDASEFRTYRVARNDELIRMLLMAAAELWQRIQDGKPPEPNWEHSSTPQLIREIHQTVADTRVQLTDEEVGWWLNYEDLGREIRKAEAERDMLKAKVNHAIGQHGGGLLTDGRMVRRARVERKGYVVNPSEYIDVRAVKADKGRIVDRAFLTEEGVIE